MTTPIAASINSTIDRSSLSLGGLVRAYFSVASRVVPKLARRQAERLFTAPPRYAGRALRPLDARRETVVSGNRALAVWQAGPLWAPAVLLVHGWGGRGAQMQSFVEPLLERGHRVVWFDQPGHGESGQGSVALPHFVRAVRTLGAMHGPFAAAIGHSLGAAALGVALRGGLELERAAFVSSPASIREHTRKFARMLGITPSIRDAMRQRLEHRYGMRFEEIDRIDDLAHLRLPALFVHDAGDAEVPFEHTLRLSARMPGARLIKTHGLGHYRILHDDGVARAIADFIGGGGGELPTELPRLPRPAPLY